MVYRYRWFKRGEFKRFIDTVELNVEKVKGL
jgi:hypothetical protein